MRGFCDEQVGCFFMPLGLSDIIFSYITLSDLENYRQSLNMQIHVIFDYSNSTSYTLAEAKPVSEKGL